jgi:uncharacterized protein YjiS (DUF1127 family)
MTESRPIALPALPMSRAWAAITRLLAESRRRRADQEALSGMSSRELCDLGLGRGEIDRVTSAMAPGRWDD